MVAARSKPNLYYRKAYEVTGALPGSKHNVKMSEIENQLNGFPLAIHAIEIRMTATIDTLASGMTANMPGARVYRAIGNVRFGILSAGHQFIRDIDGLALRHDSMRMLGYEFENTYQDITDADSTAQTQNRVLHIPFAHRTNVAGAEDDGCVPVAVFRDSDFQITVGASDAFGTAGVTLKSVSFQVYLVLKPTHKVFMPTAWEVRVLPDSVKVIQTPGNGFWHYLDIVDHDIPTLSLAGIYGQLKLTIENAIFDRRDMADFISEQNYFSRHKQIGYTVQSLTAPTFIPLISNIYDMISRQARGPVKLEIASRTTGTSYLISRINGFRDGKFVTEFLRLLGANPDDFSRPGTGCRLEVQTARGGASEVLWPSLPAAVIWPDCPFAAVKEGRAFKS